MFDLPLCLILLSVSLSAPIKADIECEKEFIALYGSNNETSTVWQAVRNISSDAAKLRILAERAHKQTGSPTTDVIDVVQFETKSLTFTQHEDPALNRASMLVDVVAYNVTRQPPARLHRNHFFYFTKGKKEGCVFYLIKWLKSRPYIRVGYHFCDVEVPV